MKLMLHFIMLYNHIKVYNFIGGFSAYKNEIAIAVDAMRTALIAKNGTEDRAKRSLRRS